MITKFPTDCCSLCHLTMSNEDTLKDIKKALKILKKETTSRNYWKTDKKYGQRAAFVITTPDEAILEKKLEEAGFTPVFDFERRNGYAPGVLTMWCINL